MEVKGKEVVVLGLGISGMEAAKLLQDYGANATVRDDAENKAPVLERAAALRQRGIRVELGKAIKESTAFDFCVLSPGIDPNTPLVRRLRQAGLPTFGELELAYRFCSCPIVAITGTNGKTTTTELVNAVLAAGGRRTVASGNIGTAFSEAVRGSKDLDVMVVEVSSFQLENISDFRPRISVHLNLTPDHLDRYKSMEEYEAAKWEIFRNQTPDDVAIVNANLRLPPIRAKRITISATGDAADYQLLDGWLVARGEQVLEQSRTNLIGPHNAENMLAALAVGDLYEVSREATIRALRAYHPLPHRLEKVAEIGGVTFLNDSKATNIDALEKALMAMRAPVVLIAGGKDKGLDFTGLSALVREKVKAVVLIGQMTEKLFAAWNSAVPCTRASTLADAVGKAHALAQSGDAVLLSPGCSSFDMFKSFEDRGDQFRELVRARAKQT
ncbi:MAG TPA: UDP-N-acetylmuramoyl-L-alanine--D-glutamate ligase [Candidatus Methylacidiphilales bacterium]|jgi:UDP-N-acetylmuramoylalanine--D-glutamate ligase|nr:UDP-N-acetylmuramoyl-L-alanine--D-glutamate ligase [Candidatus Methylacidiphilales bacterium]